MGVVTANLVAEYVAKLATGSGPGTNDPQVTAWEELVAGTYDGSLSGFAYTTDSGWAGSGTTESPYCLVGDGTGDYVTIADNTAVNPTGDFTFEFWIYVAEAPASTQYIAGSYTNYVGCRIWIAATTGRIAGQFAITGDSSTTTGGTGGDVGTGAWKHVVFTYTGGAFKQYVNANLSTTQGSGTYVPRTGSSYTLLAQAGSTPLLGKIATFRAYSAALDSDGVSANYSAGVLAASTDGVWSGLTVIRDVSS